MAVDTIVIVSFNCYWNWIIWFIWTRIKKIWCYCLFWLIFSHRNASIGMLSCVFGSLRSKIHCKKLILVFRLPEVNCSIGFSLFFHFWLHCVSAFERRSLLTYHSFHCLWYAFYAIYLCYLFNLFLIVYGNEYGMYMILKFNFYDYAFYANLFLMSMVCKRNLFMLI